MLIDTVIFGDVSLMGINDGSRCDIDDCGSGIKSDIFRIAPHVERLDSDPIRHDSGKRDLAVLEIESTASRLFGEHPDIEGRIDRLVGSAEDNGAFIGQPPFRNGKLAVFPGDLDGTGIGHRIRRERGTIRDQQRGVLRKIDRVKRSRRFVLHFKRTEFIDIQNHRADGLAAVDNELAADAGTGVDKNRRACAGRIGGLDFTRR